MGRLKIVFPVCCGMDVHRDFVIACIASTNSQGVTEYQSKPFSTYTGDLRKHAAWHMENHCSDQSLSSDPVRSLYMILPTQPSRGSPFSSMDASRNSADGLT